MPVDLHVTLLNSTDCLPRCKNKLPDSNACQKTGFKHVIGVFFDGQNKTQEVQSVFIRHFKKKYHCTHSSIWTGLFCTSCLKVELQNWLPNILSNGDELRVGLNFVFVTISSTQTVKPRTALDLTKFKFKLQRDILIWLAASEKRYPDADYVYGMQIGSVDICCLSIACSIVIKGNYRFRLWPYIFLGY